jgi:fructuronate reductase
LPQYDRDSLKPRIVHLGFGAFHRAHQAVYADILALNSSDWGYCEVNLIGGEQQIADLKAQDNLYTVAEMSADAWTPRVVGVAKRRCMRRLMGWKPCWRRCANRRWRLCR